MRIVPIVSIVLVLGTQFALAAPECQRDLVAALDASNESDVKRLLDAGCDVDTRIGIGTALHRVRSTVIARLLISRGADVNKRGMQGITPLHNLVYALNVPRERTDERERIVRLLVESGADPNIKKEDGATAFHEAARVGTIEMVRILSEAGASATAVDKAGNTPIFYLVNQPLVFAEWKESIRVGSSAPVRVLIDTVDDKTTTLVNALLALKGYQALSITRSPTDSACRLGTSEWDHKLCLRSIPTGERSASAEVLLIRTVVRGQSRDTAVGVGLPGGKAVGVGPSTTQTLPAAASTFFALMDPNRERLVRNGSRVYDRATRYAGQESLTARTFRSFSEDLDMLKLRVMSGTLAEELPARKP
jgi:hypothetical protein